MPDGLSYVSPKPNEFAGSVEGVTILVFAALRAFVYLAKRKNRSRT
jgi:hypothetical protein